MRRFAYSPIQDGMLLRALARNRSARSYPALKSKCSTITVAYRKYFINNGIATSIAPLGLTSDLSEQLIGHYKHPPKSHAYIKTLRASTGAFTCSMCGSPSCGTLDHVLPKEHYPEFSLFSRNLVPACLCNSKRGSTFKSEDGARVLHPYFDSVLDERLVGCEFSDLGHVPSIQIVNLLPPTHSEFKSVQFHIESIVLKTAVKAAMRRDWAKLLRKPSTIIRSLRINPASINHLRQLLLEELSTLDDGYDSANNWSSIFVVGLLSPVTLTWLYAKMSEPGRPDDAPILESC